MLLLATGSLLVMVDLDRESKPVPKNGLFRAFRSITTLGTSVAANDKALGFKQSFLRGHRNPIGLIEVRFYILFSKSTYSYNLAYLARYL